MSTKRWSFRAYGETVQIARADDVRGELPERTMHRSEAATFVEMLPSTTRDRLVRVELLSIAQGLDGLVGRADRLSTEQLKMRIGEALRDGRLIAVRASRPVVVVQEVQEVLGPQTSKGVWIEVELLDKKKKPVSGEAVRIKTSDGKVWNEVTGLSGRVRLEDIAPGECDITFPGLDKQTWNAA